MFARSVAGNTFIIIFKTGPTLLPTPLLSTEALFLRFAASDCGGQIPQPVRIGNIYPHCSSERLSARHFTGSRKASGFGSTQCVGWPVFLTENCITALRTTAMYRNQVDGRREMGRAVNPEDGVAGFTWLPTFLSFEAISGETVYRVFLMPT